MDTISLDLLLPAWIHDKVKSFKDIKEGYFYLTLDPVCDIEMKVPLKQISGSLNMSYNNGTWIKMIERLKRMNTFGSIGQIRRLTGDRGDKVSLIKIGRDYLILKGNHRIMLLKFFGDEFLYSDVTEYKFDYELFFYYERLKQHGFKVQLNYFNEDFPFKLHKINWTIKLNDIRIELEGREEIRRFISFHESLKTDTFSYWGYLFRKFCFSKFRSAPKFYLFEDLEVLKPLLCKFKMYKSGRKSN